MDVVAHGLWGGIGFCGRGRKKFAAAVLIGMAPDLLSFGVFHVTHPGWMQLRLAGEISGPPPLEMLPDYVFYAYNLTHSLLVWLAASGVTWAALRYPPLVLLAWGSHILCDIPTHATSYFPTPYLWPLDTPYVDGISWATPWFVVINYTALGVAYAGVIFYLRRAGRAMRT